jgi:hypothetical protein
MCGGTQVDVIRSGLKRCQVIVPLVRGNTVLEQSDPATVTGHMGVGQCHHQSKFISKIAYSHYTEQEGAFQPSLEII